jgi:hypothetical protein
MEEIRNTYTILNGKLERRLRCRWENNINMILKETRCEDVDWINLAYDKGQ